MRCNTSRVIIRRIMSVILPRPITRRLAPPPAMPSRKSSLIRGWPLSAVDRSARTPAWWSSSQRSGCRRRSTADASFAELVDAGVRQAYLDETNPLRPSIVADPLFSRLNTRDNSPAIVHVELVPGRTIELTIVAKGGGSENKARFATLNPGGDVVKWVVDTMAALGSGWCPPGMIGIGVGGSAEKAMLLAKEVLNQPIDMMELLRRGPANPFEAMRVELYEKINALGIGAQGLGGLTTVVDVKIATFPISCRVQARRSDPAVRRQPAHQPDARRFRTSGDRTAGFGGLARDLSRRCDRRRTPRRSRYADARRCERRGAQATCCCLSGKLLTGRDAAHKRIADLIARGPAAPGRSARPRHLLRRSGQGGARRGSRPSRAYDGHAHGRLHRDRAPRDGIAHNDRQGRARTGSDRGDHRLMGRRI